MSITFQVLWGSMVLFACILIHVMLLIAAVPPLQKLDQQVRSEGTRLNWAVVVGGGLAVIIAAHTIEVWLWALALVLSNALAELGEAIYFALVTYTTLGYGDVTLAPAHRIFGAFASITGLLSFGLSTAFLVGIFTRLLQRHLRDDAKQ